jgi:hypothetical protein
MTYRSDVMAQEGGPQDRADDARSLQVILGEPDWTEADQEAQSRLDALTEAEEGHDGLSSR